MTYSSKASAQTQQARQSPAGAPGTSTSVAGRVVDFSGKGLAGVVVSLRKAADSAQVAGIATEPSGKFSFSQLKPGTYYIQATYIGFQTYLTRSFPLNEFNQTILPVITLTERTTAIKGITVTAKKPFIERMVDKTVLNIESDVIASGGTALEALQRAPGVTVDKDDNIQLRGKAGVMVMIDDKITYMSMAQVTTMLKSMPASSISQIEVITQPSAKYDAAGNMGIINIKTKKLKKMGLNGVLTAGAGYGKYPKTNASLNLNYEKGKFNFFVNYDFSRNKNYGTLNLERTVNSKKDTTHFNQLGRFDNDYTNQNYKAGLDYSLTKNNTLGFQVSGYSNFGQTLTTSNSLINNLHKPSSLPDSVLRAESSNPGTFRSIDYTLNYRGKPDTLGTELSADLDYSRFVNSQHMNLTNTLLGPDRNQILKGPFTILNNLPSTIDIKVEKVDFSHPFSKTLKLETGAKYSAVTTKNAVEYDSLMNSRPVLSKSQSNQFIYKEKIAALYASLNKQFGKNTSLQMGLRIEHTASEGNSITLNKDVKRSYTDFFPNISFSQKIDSLHQLSLSYTRRIDRPSYQDLNPFRFYIDQYTYQEGNPYLNPQYTDAFELSHTYKQSTIITLNYSHTRNAMIQTLLQDSSTKVTKQTNSNISGINSFGLTFSTPLILAKWWTITPNLNINFNKYLASARSLGGALNAGIIAWNLNVTSTFTLPEDYTIELNGFYNSAAQYGYLHADPQYSISGGIQKSFWKKKANLKLNVNDLFDLNKFSGRQPNINLIVLNHWESRRATLTFTYRFGSNPNAGQKKDTGAEDEKNRVRSGH